MNPPAFIMSKSKALLFLAHHPGTAGICRQYGCTHLNPCLSAAGVVSVDKQKRAAPQFQACGWTDAPRTLCNAPACIAQEKEGLTHVALHVPQ